MSVCDTKKRKISEVTSKGEIEAFAEMGEERNRDKGGNRGMT